jgi:HTH-type transcriptional regulator, transcriptional repressor of NAD biosynthesis genes
MSNRKVGMYGGKFIPVHMGHVYSMIRASTMVDELHVIVSYDDEYEKKTLFKEAKIPHIPYNVRLRWWKEITKDMSHVHVHAVEEKQTGQFSDWERGAEGIKAAVGKEIDTVFSSEQAYGEFFEKLYPGAEHVVLDENRVAYPISATILRTEGIMKHWNMLPEVVKPFFAKRVVIVGTESVGKSTLVKNLANLYNTTYVEEFGRTYYERIGDYNTMPSDFPEIAFEHQYQIKKQLEKANKVLFVDTEAIVTQNFSIAYEGIRQPILDEVAKLQHFDLWLFLEPDVKWVNDGTRVFGEEAVRKENADRLKSLLEEHDVRYVSISGNYQERLEQAVHLVNDLVEMEGL